MIVRFSKHARDRSRERSISKETIRRALANPDKIKHLEGDKFLCYSETNGKKLVVVFLKSKEFITVITLYYEDYIR